MRPHPYHGIKLTLKRSWSSVLRSEVNPFLLLRLLNTGELKPIVNPNRRNPKATIVQAYVAGQARVRFSCEIICAESVVLAGRSHNSCSEAMSGLSSSVSEESASSIDCFEIGSKLRNQKTEKWKGLVLIETNTFFAWRTAYTVIEEKNETRYMEGTETQRIHPQI